MTIQSYPLCPDWQTYTSRTWAYRSSSSWSFEPEAAFITWTMEYDEENVGAIRKQFWTRPPVRLQDFEMQYLGQRPVQEHNNNNNLLHLYSAFLDTQSALHSKGTISSSTTNVQHPPGWCDGSHSAPERPPHTSLLVERRQSDEANQCMGMIRRPWWSEASGVVWPGCRGNTPTLFRKTSWDF